VHELAERTTQGEFDELDEPALSEALDVAWRDAVAERAAELQRAWRTAVPPGPERWSGSALARVRWRGYGPWIVEFFDAGAGGKRTKRPA